jgi:hypothetical protein
MFLDISSFSEKKLLKLDSESVYNKPELINKDDFINEQENNTEETRLKPIALIDTPLYEQIKYYINYLIDLLFERSIF